VQNPPELTEKVKATALKGIFPHTKSSSAKEVELLQMSTYESGVQGLRT